MSTAMTYTPKIPLSGRLLWPFAKRFIAGTHLNQALEVVEKYNLEGFLTTLDMLGEDIYDPEMAEAAADRYIEMLKKLAERGLDKNVSLKLTQMGLDISKDLTIDNVSRIAEFAKSINGFVRIDMEGSNLTSQTLDVVYELHSRGLPVGTVVQTALKRTPTDVVKLLENGITIRLCKGAYKEPPEIAYQTKEDIRRQYESLTQRLLTSNLYHGLATHDDKLIDFACEFSKRANISKDSFEFQMLLGIRTKLQRKLLKKGFKVRVYVPFGSHWLPYTWRRLRERKENVLFVFRSLLGG